MTTSTSSAPTTRGERHRLVDALRGFALLGILLVNAEFIFQHANLGWSEFTSGPDLAARWIVTAAGQAKIYLLFAFLFGYGLSLQLTRAASSGARLGGRYQRRMIGLIALGILHGILFFPGDILVIYGVVGAIAYRLRHADSRQLVKIAGVTYAVAATVWILIGFLDLAFFSGPPSASAESLQAFSGGSFLEVVGQHLKDWPWTLAVLALIQGPAAFSLFLAGVAVGRGDLLSHPERHTAVAHRILRQAAPIGVCGAALGATLLVIGGAWATLGFAVGFATAPALTATYVALLALALGSRPGPLGQSLEATGRMSLSIYLLQSIVVSTLSYGYGLGLFGETGALESIGILLVVWAGLTAFAVTWFRLFRFGPAEWVLRSITYLRPQRLRA